MKQNIAAYALKTLAAKKAKSVDKVYEGTLLKIDNAMDKGYYVGVKNTDVISYQFKKKMEEHNMFIHTLDAMSQKGRAIDIHTINPITGRYMSGSSSGTALNVFMNINDIGIGTDGGGSVLAPALALNLYAMISPLFDQHALRKHSKTSTDGIVFSPSIGFMSKRPELIKKSIEAHLKISALAYDIYFGTSNLEVHANLNKVFQDYKTYPLAYEGLDRQAMMAELKGFDFDKNILVTCEGPVDVIEYGDSIMGHYDALTQSKQALGHKYYLKVVNMLGLSAFIVPTTEHARGFLIICKSDAPALGAAYELMSSLPFRRSELEASYFDATTSIGKDVL